MEITNARWGDAEHTFILADLDGNESRIPVGSRFHADIEASAESETPIIVAPFRRWATLDDAVEALTLAVENRAREMRVAVAGTRDATKLAVYREKYAVACAAISGDAGALAKLAPEAEARGQSAASLAALVKALGDAWINAGLVIDAAYQTHKSAVAGLADLDAAEAYDIAAGWPDLTP